MSLLFFWSFYRLQESIMKLDQRTDRPKDCFSILVLIFSIGYLYLPLLNAWYLGDDTQWMYFAATNPVFKILFDRETYLNISEANFTPMAALSFKVDWQLFRMNPVGYNVHCLLALLGSSLVLYAFLRLYTGRWTALAGSMLFVLNPAGASVVSCFSNRHYLEGMFWALTSLYLFVRSERDDKKYYFVFSLLAYIFASLYKEVYLVLPALIFLIAKSRMTERIRKTAPFWMALLLYFPWRWHMLGGRMGGYYFIEWTFKGLISQALMAVVLPIKYAYGKYWVIFLIFFALMSIAVILRKGGYRKYITAIGAYGISLAPVIPIMGIFVASGPAGGRFAFQITTFLIIVSTLAFSLVKNSKAVIVVVVVLFFLSLGIFHGHALAVRDAFIRDRDNARMESLKFTENKKYLKAAYPVWFYDGLRKLYRRFEMKEIETQVFCEETLQYHDPFVIRDVKGNDAHIYIEKQKGFKQGPLSVDLSWDDRILKWRLAPPHVKAFELLFRKDNEFYFLYPPIKGMGEHFFPRDAVTNESVYFRIFYRLPDGTEVVSPEIRIFLPGHGTFSYSAQAS